MKTERTRSNTAIVAKAWRLNGGRVELPKEGGMCTFTLLASGNCTLTCGSTTLALNPGCAVLLGAGAGGVLQQTSRTVPELIGCGFSTAMLSEARGAPQRDLARLFATQMPTVLHGSPQWNNRLRTLLELMQSAQEEPDFPGTVYLELVLHYVAQQYNAEALLAVRPHNETIDQICAYLSENYAQKLPLSEVATRFYLSPYYLSRLFRRVTGQSIVDYINSRRIEAAQRLLETTDLSISTVAEQTGFSTAAHFRRVFREEMGVGPLQYRKGHKKE